MSDNLSNLRIIPSVPSETIGTFFKLMIGVVVAYVIVRVLEAHTYFFPDAEAFTGLIHISGTLYSVLYAFATYVIWGQFIAVESEILKEAGALKDIILFSRQLKDSERDPIVRGIRIYARAVVEREWPQLSAAEPPEETERLFLNIITSVTEAKDAEENSRAIYTQLLEIMKDASMHRNERIALSTKRIPRTLLTFVMLMATMIFLLILFYPYHNMGLGLASIAATTFLLFVAHFVLTDLDNPFEGSWNVNSGPFSELVTKFK